MFNWLVGVVGVVAVRFLLVLVKFWASKALTLGLVKELVAAWLYVCVGDVDDKAWLICGAIGFEAEVFFYKIIF